MDAEILLNLIAILFYSEIAGALLIALGIRMWEMRFDELELKRRLRKK